MYDPLVDEQQNEDTANLNVPWYMVLEEGKFNIFWQFIFSLLVFINFIYAPFITAMSHIRRAQAETVYTFETSIELFWGLSIFINLFMASQERKIFTF